MAQKVIRTGNSLAVTIPARLATLIGIRAGDEVKLEAEVEKGRLSYFFSSAKQLPLAENFLSNQKHHHFTKSKKSKK